MAHVVVGVFVYAVGLCVGSFLNVVIYRLPRGLSISKPVWSFCPHCKTTLRWYDNLPVLGWLLLRGRCRYCHKPISAQYPLVEAITGLAFVLTYYLLFVAHARVLGVTRLGVVPLQPSLPTDIPLLLAWLVLVAALIACSGMDLLWYVVDTRITDAALFAGVVLHVFWPRPEFFAARAATPGAAATLAAFLVSGLMLWLTAWRAPPEDDRQAELHPSEGEESDQPAPRAFRTATVFGIAVFVGLAVVLLVNPASPRTGPSLVSQYSVLGALAALFLLMVLAGGQPRDVDEELRAAIEAEAPTSRRAILGELAWLTPATAAGVATYVVLVYVPAAESVWQRAAGWRIAGQFTPIGGASFAIYGAIVGAAAGWILRIFFTLVFGREAFGTGDIYILAAAGAVAGWDIALLGLLLSVFIALLGWIIGLVLKRPGMIPFGPPLAIGFLAALWLNRGGTARVYSLYNDFMQVWRDQRHIALILIGLMISVLPISIFLAKLTRRLVEPPAQEAETEPVEDEPPAPPAES